MGRCRAGGVGWVAGLAVLAALVVVPNVAAAKPRPAKLAAVYGVTGKRVLSVSGFARVARKGDRVRLETRAGKRFGVRRAGRVRRNGRFALRWRYPRRARALVVRVRVLRRSKGKRRRAKRRVVAAGSWRRVRVRGVRRARRRAPVRAGQVISLPPADIGGQLVLSGRPRVRKGQVVALGQSPRTPAGVLQRVTAVSRSGRTTVLTTVPASIPDVIPAGSMDVRLPRRSAPRVARLSSRRDASVQCTSEETMSASADVDLSSWTHLEASWGPFAGLKAKFTGTAGASASLKATVSGEAACDINPIGVFPGGIDLGTYRFTIAGIPIVLQPNGQIYLSGRAEANARMSASASASLTATAGVAFEDGTFKPFGGLTPRTSYSPPDLSAGGSLGLYAAPAVYVKINGIGGPELDLTSGFELAADVGATPWWTLTAPLSAGVKFKVNVWRVNKESDRFEIFSTRRTLASANGPSPIPPPPVDRGPVNRATLTWDTETDVDLHVWDDEGNHTYFGDQEAIPDALLVEDIIPGYGPEYFEETGSYGRRYTYGICQFTGDGSDVSLTITDPNGQQRNVTGSLNFEEDYAILDTGPTGGGYVPPDGWCG